MGREWQSWHRAAPPRRGRYAVGHGLSAGPARLQFQFRRGVSGAQPLCPGEPAAVHLELLDAAARRGDPQLSRRRAADLADLSGARLDRHSTDPERRQGAERGGRGRRADQVRHALRPHPGGNALALCELRAAEPAADRKPDSRAVSRAPQGPEAAAGGHLVHVRLRLHGGARGVFPGSTPGR